MTIFIAFLLATIFASLAGLHFYWGLGGKWGIDLAVPTNEQGRKVLKTSVLSCFVVGFGLLGFGGLVLINSNIWLVAIPLWLYHTGLWIVAGIFFARAIGEFKYVGFFKTVRQTPFAELDTHYFSPLCALIAGFAAYLQYAQI